MSGARPLPVPPADCVPGCMGLRACVSDICSRVSRTGQRIWCLECTSSLKDRDPVWLRTRLPSHPVGERYDLCTCTLGTASRPCDVFGRYQMVPLSPITLLGFPHSHTVTLPLCLLCWAPLCLLAPCPPKSSVRVLQHSFTCSC